MKLTSPLVILLCLLCHPVSGQLLDSSCPIEPVINAVANLQCWDGKTPIELSGHWQLDYQADRETHQYAGLAKVPMRWQDFSPPLPFTGHGIYRIAIKLSEPMNFLGLKLPRSNMARKLLLVDHLGNRQVIFDSGHSNYNDRAIVNMRMPIVSLPRLDKYNELILIIRNSESVNGGIEDKVILAPITELTRQEQVFKIYAASISTILAIFFVFNIGLWAVRRQDPTLLTLGLLSFFLAIRQTTVSGFLFDLIPVLSTQFDALVGWVTFYGSIISGGLYLRFSYPALIPRWLPVIAIIATIIGIGLFVTQPLYIVQIYGSYYRLVTLVLTAVVIGLLLAGLRRPNHEIKFTLFGCAVMLMGVSADIFYFHIIEYSSIISLSAVGLLIFVGTQTILMSQRYLSSLRQSANLAKELQLLNASLEYKVEARTVELANKNKRLEDLAHTDTLTGLANRRAFDDLVSKELTRAKRSGLSMVIGMVDLDHFKSVNDRFGHSVGDLVLQEVATILKESLRNADIVCRWGGEEFCILFPETTAEEAFKVSDRIRQIIAKHPLSTGTETISITTSIGLQIWQPDKDIKNTFQAADKALYHSKITGRNNVTGFWQMSDIQS